jgi:uncharacterized protein with PQ loop repeat
MKNKRDIVFKAGLGLQLLLVPIAFLWRFGPEANYYNWVLIICLAVVAALFFWPQAIVVRLKRLRAIKIQFALVVALLVVSWLGYGYFYNFTRTNCYPSPAPNGIGVSYTAADRDKNCSFDPSSMPTVIYSVNWEAILGRRWVVPLGPGISIPSALGLTAVFLALPAANLYRYQLDKKRVNGVKKEELFV